MMSVTSTANQIWSERWRLAVLPREQYVKLGLAAVIAGLAFLLFHIQGNTTDIRMYGRSAIIWMVDRWIDPQGEFSHGWLIPLASLWFLWRRRKAIGEAPKSASRLGLTLVVLALLTHWLGAKAQQVRLSLFALIGLMWGVPFYFYGWQVARQLIFPLSYLIFCVPLNFLDSLTFPLRILVTITATGILNGLGIAVQRSGSAIYRAVEGGFELDVADPCSGLRSLIAMTALTAVYAQVTQTTLTKKWLLFLAAIPLAIVGNIARITTVGLVAEAFGQDLAVGLYHDYSGYLFYTVSIGLMIGLGSLMNTSFRGVFTRWKQALLSPTSLSSPSSS